MKIQALGAMALLFFSTTVCAQTVDQAARMRLFHDAAPAQRMVEGVIKANPDMIDVLLHVTPPDAARNLVVAAHLTHAIGEVSGDDDLGVMQNDKPLVEVQKDGVRIGVLVQMRDAASRPIGALGLMYPYHPGDDQTAVLTRSLKIRDRLAHDVKSRRALFL